MVSGGAPWPEDDAVSGGVEKFGKPLFQITVRSAGYITLMCLVCFYRQQDDQRKTQTCIFLLFRGSDPETVARAQNPHSCRGKQKQTLWFESQLPRSATACERAFDRLALTAVRERDIIAVGGE